MKHIYSLHKIKSWGIAMIMLLLLLCSHIKSHAQFVRAQGTQIVDPNGNPIFFSGINLGNWLLWEGYLMMGDFNFKTHTQFFNDIKSAFNGNHTQAMEFEHQWRMHYVTERAIADLKNLGFNSVRVPFHYNLFWDGTQLTNRGFQYFDRVIEYCRAHGMYVLLDMHAAPGYQNPGDHSDNVNSNASQPRHTVTFWDGNNVNIAAQVWRHIANRYRNEPVIWGYDLINEPVPQAGREYELLPSFITMRNAIRQVDNNHIIVAEGSWWGSDLTKIDWMDPVTRSNTGITARWDNNLVYQVHHYVFGNAAAINDLNGRKAITDKLNVPLILGEYGEDTNNILRQMTDWCINNNVGYFPWSFKKMYHDRTLWTIPANSNYNAVRNFIRDGGTPPPNAYNNMISFCQNNIANGSPGIIYDNNFYNAIKPNTPPPVVVHSVPGTIQAESYFNQFGTQTESTSDTGGGLNVGWIDNGDWMAYRINVPSTATYTVEYRISSPNSNGRITLQPYGGDTAFGNIAVPNTGGWQSWQTISHTVQLQAGQQDIAIVATTGGFNINWFRISGSTPPPPSGAPIGQTIWLRGTNNRYVSSENGQTAMRCNRTSVGGWEQFTVVNAGSGRIALRGSNGRYVSSENGQTGMMCNRTTIGGWEAFDWIDIGGGQIALRGTNNRYVSSENGQSAMMCNRTSVGGWEAFTWGNVSGSRMDFDATEDIKAQKEGEYEELLLNRADAHHAEPASIQIYPNPAEKAFRIKVTAPSIVSITDISGRKYLMKEVKEGITINDLKPGLYMVMINDGQKVLTRKVIVK